jgi:hypothetical protein
MNSIGYKNQPDNRFSAAGAIARTPLSERKHCEDAAIAKQCKVICLRCQLLLAMF